MNFSEIIKKIESSNARLFKEAVILEQMRENNEIFFQGLNLAYNKLLTFGVKQIPFSKKMVKDSFGKNLKKLQIV